MTRKYRPSRTRAGHAALVVMLSISARANGQAQHVDPSSGRDDDVEISVPASPPPPSPAPPSTPPPSAAAATPGPAPAPVGNLDRSPSSLAGLPSTTAPAGASDARDSQTLVAEGSNYVRPVRRGLQWWGFVQAQYQRNQISEDQLAPGGEPLNQDQFVLRRARLRIDHGWENAAATLELDTTTVNGLSVRPRRAEASILYRGETDDRITPRLVLTAGITDLPFGAELGESQRDRVFMERSVGSTALFPTEADVGVKLWGAYRFLNYAVAVVNGQPLVERALPRAPIGAKDVVGRVGARIPVLSSLSLEGGVSFYNGTGFSPGQDATKDSISWVDDNNNGFAEPHELQGVPGSAAVPSQTFGRWALGVDLGAVQRTFLGVTRIAGEAAVASNLDRGLLVSDPVVSGADVRQLILSVSGLQQLSDYGFVGFRAAYYDPNSDLLEQRAGVFHVKDESFVVLSPSLGFTLPHGRLVGQYDIVADHLARDDRGVPTNAKNNQLTLRLQVDL